MSSNDIFGLTDSDVRVALCALKVMLVDGTPKVDKDHLAKLTGHKNADSANRVWNMAKAKLMKGEASSEAATSLGVVTPTKGTRKTAAKMGHSNHQEARQEVSPQGR
ncbi:hypothetical protein DHEL01_v209897 [Diaporthe helianthi]|uniref:Uncharacterized protein n=1 Tax=Diaporthe helianthi TaxID=158607 RepID=A0A2P5HN79_DIAHE|nr:hypothetical protein DHEL01_v209897 [Diaporthe helianthi]